MKTKLFSVSHLISGKYLITSCGHTEESVVALVGSVIEKGGQFNITEQDGPQPQLFQLPEGAYHVMMWARPKAARAGAEHWQEKQSDWSFFDGSTCKMGREWRPCMISGISTSQRVRVIGSNGGYELSLFEFCDAPLTISPELT